MPPVLLAAAVRVIRPLRVSTIVPTGSCSPSVSLRNRLRLGSLTFTIPLFGVPFTVLPITGGLSLLVIVHVATCPSASVTAPAELHVPENDREYRLSASSETV